MKELRLTGRIKKEANGTFTGFITSHWLDQMYYEKVWSKGGYTSKRQCQQDISNFIKKVEDLFKDATKALTLD